MANRFRRAFGHDFAAAAADFQARIKIQPVAVCILTVPPVAQVSKPAVSPISNRQGVRSREVGGLETRDTADLEIGATAVVRSCPPENGRFLRLRGGRIVGRCAHGRAIADKMRQFAPKLFSHGCDRLSPIRISQNWRRLI